MILNRETNVHFFRNGDTNTLKRILVVITRFFGERIIIKIWYVGIFLVEIFTSEMFSERRTIFFKKKSRKSKGLDFSEFHKVSQSRNPFDDHRVVTVIVRKLHRVLFP